MVLWSAQILLSAKSDGSTRDEIIEKGLALTPAPFQARALQFLGGDAQ